MISNKNIKVLNKQIKHMESMDNAIKWEEVSIKRGDNKPSTHHLEKLYFQLWKDRSLRKVRKLLITQESNKSIASVFEEHYH